MAITPAKLGDYNFDELYSQYYRKLIAFIRYRYKFSKEVTEDIVQDTFAIAYEKREQFEQRSHPKAWIWSIARHRALNYLRWLQVRGHKISYDEGFHGIDEVVNAHNIGPDSVSKNRAELSTMLKQIKQPKPRQIFELYYIQGKSYKEIAKELGMEEQTVRQNSFRAKKELIALYAPERLEN